MTTNQTEFYLGLERATSALHRDAERTAAAQAKAVHASMATLLADTPVANQLACRRGCSHCCHYPVGISYAETLRLAESVCEHAELRERIRFACEATQEQSWEQLVGQPCPLLVDDACAAHEARPMPCRALGSLDANACRDALHTDLAPPRDETAWWRGLGAAHALAQLAPGGSRELRAAVHAALTATDETMQAAWLAARATPAS